MNNIIQHIKQITVAHLASPVNTQKIILCQKELTQNGNAMLPNAFLDILHSFNAVSYDGARIFGINPESKVFMDIVLANQMSPLAGKQNMVLLGCDEFDYLAYNAQTQTYQIIDKEDLEVLEEYSEIEPAIKHILKI